MCASARQCAAIRRSRRKAPHIALGHQSRRDAIRSHRADAAGPECRLAVADAMTPSRIRQPRVSASRVPTERLLAGPASVSDDVVRDHAENCTECAALAPCGARSDRLDHRTAIARAVGCCVSRWLRRRSIFESLFLDETADRKDQRYIIRDAEHFAPSRARARIGLETFAVDAVRNHIRSGRVGADGRGAQAEILAAGRHPARAFKCRARGESRNWVPLGDEHVGSVQADDERNGASRGRADNAARDYPVRVDDGRAFFLRDPQRLEPPRQTASWATATADARRRTSARMPRRSRTLFALYRCVVKEMEWTPRRSSADSISGAMADEMQPRALAQPYLRDRSMKLPTNRPRERGYDEAIITMRSLLGARFARTII